MFYQETRNRDGLPVPKLPTVKRWNTKNSPDWALDRLLMMTGNHNDFPGIEIRRKLIVISETGESITTTQLKNFYYREQIFHQILNNSKSVDRKNQHVESLMQPANDEFAINVYQSLPK